MKTGDKVKVIRVDEFCDEGTNLAVGMEGAIENECCANDGADCDSFDVRLQEDFNANGNMNLNNDGTYQLTRDQLEVIE